MKLVLAVIDGCKPAMLERAIAQGRAPFLAAVSERGTFVPELCAAFPSVTPVCATAIATGALQDRHHIPGMNWWHRAEGRYVEYGSSFRAARRFGISQQLTDTVYRLNGEHLSEDCPTLFESLDDAGLRTAGTTYLVYRGRHEHDISRETALTRLASAVFRRPPVRGPRELFYADIFASRETGCRSQLGLPGMRDQHAGCVGSWLETRDLYDFLLLSLPDNDTHSHKHGPHAQPDSIARADEQLLRLAEAGGGLDEFLETHAVVVCADHSHAAVERTADLREAFADWAVAGPGGAPVEDAEIALCPNQRAAMAYVLDVTRRAELVPRIVATAAAVDGVDVIAWREDGWGMLRGAQGAVLRFRPGGHARDLRGDPWELAGDLEAIGLAVDGEHVHAHDYPDALRRVWAALTCPTSGDVLVSAGPGWEFPDWGGVAHVGGGSHGSLHRSDSLGALVFSGCGPALGQPLQSWSITDAAAMVRSHFGV